MLLYDKNFLNILKFFGFLKFYQRHVMKFLDFNIATTFHIRKIKDERRIMSQATNKEVGFPSQ